MMADTTRPTSASMPSNTMTTLTHFSAEPSFKRGAEMEIRCI